MASSVNCDDDDPTSGRDRNDKIIIIGAGAAGLAAAGELIDLGFKNIRILEARDRIGGRVWTDTSTGTPLDLGASWIHGTDGNPMTSLSNEYGIERSKNTDYDSHTVYHHSEGELSDSEVDGDTNSLYSILSNLADYGEDLDNDISLFDALTAEGHFPSGTVDREKFDFYLNTEIEHEYTGAVDTMSLWWWNEAGEYDGGDVIFPGGMSQLVQAMSDDYDLDDITELSKVVTGIEYEDNEVVVTAGDGSVYTGDAVLVTVPLGILKAGNISFSPTLPAKKQTAIDNLGFSVLNKLYLEFDTVFWDDSDIIGYIDSTKGRWAEWLNVESHIDGKNILLGFNAAEYGTQIEDDSDAGIISDAMDVLRDMYPGAPDPVASVITRWGQDEYTLGSYSYFKTGSLPSSIDDLFEPVDNLVFFAGEATHKIHPGTVHGAILSGYAAAEAIAGD